MWKVVSFMLFLATGCASETRSYDIRLWNKTSSPLTLSLAKDSGPYEEVWASPEQLRGQKDKLGDTWSLVFVPAGGIANTQKVSGQFTPGSKAWLRAYQGDLTIGDMLKISPGNPQRVDVPLKPGVNDISIANRGGRLTWTGSQP